MSNNIPISEQIQDNNNKIDTLNNFITYNIEEKIKLQPELDKIPDNSDNATKERINKLKELETKIERQYKYQLQLFNENVGLGESTATQPVNPFQKEKQIRLQKQQQKYIKKEFSQDPPLSNVSSTQRSFLTNNALVPPPVVTNSAHRRPPKEESVGFSETLKKRAKKPEPYISVDPNICENIFTNGSKVTTKYFYPSQIPKITKIKPITVSIKKGGKRKSRKLIKKRKY